MNIIWWANLGEGYCQDGVLYHSDSPSPPKDLFLQLLGKLLAKESCLAYSNTPFPGKPASSDWLLQGIKA